MPGYVVIASPSWCAPLPSGQIAGVLGKTCHMDVPSKFASGTPIRQSTTSRTPTIVAITW